MTKETKKKGNTQKTQKPTKQKNKERKKEGRNNLEKLKRMILFRTKA
jgi:hypothetical protein